MCSSRTGASGGASPRATSRIRVTGRSAASCRRCSLTRSSDPVVRNRTPTGPLGRPLRQHRKVPVRAFDTPSSAFCLPFPQNVVFLHGKFVSRHGLRGRTVRLRRLSCSPHFSLDPIAGAAPAPPAGAIPATFPTSRPAPKTPADVRKDLSMSVRAFLCRSCLSLLGVMMLAVLVSTSFAQTLDTPSITVKRSGFFRIDMDVQAGASGAPNGFTVQWMKKADFDAYGWPATESDPGSVYCDFTGDPTLNLDSRSGTFQLASHGVIGIQMGDLFDETGIYGSYLDHLEPGAYVFRVWAEGSAAAGGQTSSAPSTLVFAETSNPECTQGFWKTHPEAWPLGCTPMTLGTVTYTKTELLSILNQPALGNGLISLAHQLIAGNLNVCNGSTSSSCASATATATPLIGGKGTPPVGTDFVAPSTTDGTTNTLDDWNNGLIPGVVACVTAARRSTWGAVKSMYR